MHLNVKLIKDMAAGAVLIAAIISFIIAFIIFIPKFL
jgi:diacylglycerol kinase